MRDEARRIAQYRQAAGAGAMNDLLLQLIIVVAAGAFCFGCGFLTAFIVTRNKWRREMIRRGGARYKSQTGKWEWGEPPEKPKAWEVQ
jgi:heme/copper-type cytochrome/quinol oxidase subunit 1